ncbi:DUF2169 family type VI secretion system accessory protein [Pseudoduganella lutea]|uniref:DUF2169 domain-containing protein n=1 Tax=Pseudoduganella lutea TaxID=321985 RepID=A0A4P6L4L3_9BURK|nr:DUF2169 domain-containing protein [Pseudoduganella lutea]QBE66541.1 DUF2169 domain-containing protein [Pseudoduganella lutea]
MNVVIDSKYLAADTAVALDAAGREHLVVVAKATWSIPASGQRPRPQIPQPLVQSDIYAGDPGQSAMLYGADFARFKPRCDILFNASAHAPDGEPVPEIVVAWQVGAVRKGLRVLGPRVWRSHIGILTMSKPEPFTTLPLHHGFAFGGTRTHEDGDGEKLYESYLENPAGIGWAGPATRKQLRDAPAPRLEALDDPIRNALGKHAPAAFSAIGRHWMPRKAHAGTYDDTWRRDVFPLLPEDFDERYHQCAPEDQQMDYPQGGEPVILRNMMPGRPDVRFSLPPIKRQTVRILRTDYTNEVLEAVPDTLYFEPDENRFSVVWRISTPIKRRQQEFDTVAIGPVSASWWKAKTLGQGAGCAGCGGDQGELDEVSA